MKRVIGLFAAMLIFSPSMDLTPGGDAHAAPGV
jgi:hypothetical protein